MTNKYDVIVSGAGIGGLFAAAKLVKHGKKVLLIEQHFIAGGYATSFKRKGFTFEAGLHALDDMGPDSANESLFNEFNLLKQSEIIRLPELFTIIRGNMRETLPDNKEQAYTVLTKQFPQEKKAIGKFLNVLDKIHDEVLSVPENRWKMLLQLPLLPFKYYRVLKHFFDTLGSFLDRFFKNEDLKILLAGNTGYYHDDPYLYSSLHYGGAQGSYISGGAYFLKGGSERLIKQLTEYITENGGTFKFNCEVKEILSKDNKSVSGVKFKDKNGNIHEAYSDALVANNAIPTVIEMLPKNLSQKLQKKYNNYSKSHTLFVVYIGMNKPLHDLGNDSYSLFILPEELKTLKDMAKYNQTDDFSKKILSLVDYSLLKNELSSEDTNENVCAIAVIDKIKNWEKLSKEDYQAQKKKYSEILIERVEKSIPGFKDNINIYESATPKTFRAYTLNPEGSVYGYSNILKQIGPNRPQTNSGIKNLYFASAWSKPGGGITPSAKSGFRAACAILKRDGEL